MYNTSSGRFRHYIEVYNPTFVDGPRGQVEADVFVFDCRCDIMVKSGKQLNEIGAVLTENIISILMRYDERLEDQHVIVWNGKRYEVQNNVPDERERDAMVTAKRIKV